MEMLDGTRLWGYKKRDCWCRIVMIPGKYAGKLDAQDPEGLLR
jgi:hypothetical protein